MLALSFKEAPLLCCFLPLPPACLLFLLSRIEHMKQSFLDFIKQHPQHSSFPPPAWKWSGETSSVPSKSSSSAVVSNAGNFHHDPQPAHSSSNPSDSPSESGPLLKEHDYIGLAEVSSTSSSVSDNDSASDVEDTDLRLAIGPRKDDYSAQRRVLPVELELLEPKENSTLAAQCSQPTSASALTSPSAVLLPKNGFKRAFGEALCDGRVGTSCAFKQAQGSSQSDQQNMFVSGWPVPSLNGGFPNTDTNARLDDLERYDSALVEPPAKGQVVGWPPIRSYRRNTLSTAHNQAAADGEGHSAVYVKVNMDGIPIGRKVDLKIYLSYESLQKALEEMFYSPSSGNCTQFLTNGTFVLTYEDKEGDWMLVGDVPWGMFVNTVRRLRIVRASEATGLAPRR